MGSVSAADTDPHSVSIVVPVYRGASTISSLVDEILEMAEVGTTPGGARFAVAEVLLVHDCGPDDSDEAIRRLADRHEIVRPIWLSRNFGQHSATLAGMASTSTDWIATMDEDGQHDPADVPRMLDVALVNRATVVYAEPTNAAPHGRFRNAASQLAKFVFTRVLSGDNPPKFNSFRLVLGEVGRSVAAYGGAGVYLDVALGWVTQRFATCPVELRSEGDRVSGYPLRRLISHFWRLVLSSGTRPLRLVSVMGSIFAALGFLGAIVILTGRIIGAIDVAGWASLSIIVMVGTGMILFSLGLVAEYVGVAAQMAMGKPPFLIVGDLPEGPHGRRTTDAA